MAYKCGCGAEFTDVSEYIKHKRSHQEQMQIRKGVICLACGTAIPTPENFSGMVSCPSCHKSMKVVVEQGEVSTVVLK